MNLVPTTSFRYRHDAEAAAQAVTSAGIRCSVREPGEAPPGWRMHDAELRYTVWVEAARSEEARRIIRGVQAQAASFVCDRCGAVPATIHITEWRGGQARITNLCAGCHDAAGMGGG